MIKLKGNYSDLVERDGIAEKYKMVEKICFKINEVCFL